MKQAAWRFPVAPEQNTREHVMPLAPGARRNVGQFPAWFGLVLLAFDTGVLALAGGAAIYFSGFLQSLWFHITPYTMAEHTVLTRLNIYSGLCVAILLMFASKGLYTRRVPWWSQVLFIGKVVGLAFLIDGFISFALKIHVSRLLIFLNWGIVFGLLILLRYIAFRLVACMKWWKIPTVIMGDNASVTDLIYAFHADRYSGYEVHTVFLRDKRYQQFDRDSLPPGCRNIRLHDGLQECESYIYNHPDSYYVIAVDAFRGYKRERLIRMLDRCGISYAIVPSVVHAGFYEMDPHYFFGHDIMMMRSYPARHGRITLPKIIKRSFDILVAGALLVLLLPGFAIIALLLKLEGQGGSVFYGGKRVGYKGRLFKCWKFRSMEPDSDHLLHAFLGANPILKARWDKYRKLPRDPRITTRTARIIRKLSLDELPQLWNVLKGDMSIVGPRPILEEEKIYFGDRLKEYTSVRPGITGLWQVSGRNATSFMRRVSWDSWYIRNWSLWHDVIIMIKTPVALLSRRGAH